MSVAEPLRIVEVTSRDINLRGAGCQVWRVKARISGALCERARDACHCGHTRGGPGLGNIADVLPEASVAAALHSLVRNPRWIKLDERAIVLGREHFCAAFTATNVA